jgi:transposase
LAVDAHGMPVRVIITTGPRADCKEASQLIDGINAGYLLADKGYDSNSIVEQAESFGMIAVIPPRQHRKEKRAYDQELYKLHHLVENAFLHLKRWRGIATRYAKNSASFLAAVQIRCIALWAEISWRHYLKQYFFVGILTLISSLAASAMDSMDESIVHDLNRGNTYRNVGEDLEQLKGTIAYSLGMMCWKGRGGKKDKKEAFRYFLEAAEQGHPRAQHIVELVYAKGNSEEKWRRSRTMARKSG